MLIVLSAVPKLEPRWHRVSIEAFGGGTTFVTTVVTMVGGTRLRPPPPPGGVARWRRR